MPCALTRTSQKTINVQSHVVTWKADGERYVLYMDSSRGTETVYLINRKFDMFDLLESHQTAARAILSSFDDARHGCTILDGELITNQSTGKQDYIIFDMLCDNDSQIHRSSYTERISRVHKRLGNLSNCIDSQTYASLSLHITVKNFYPVSELYTLIESIRPTGPAQFLYQNMYECDGIVFIPRGEYTTRVDRNMLKVKLAVSQITIDFQLNSMPRGNLWTFSCMGPNNELLECRRQPLDPEQKKICTDMLVEYEKQRRNRPDLRLIVECCYDAQEGVWIVKKRRTDKNLPNSYSVYCETMETLVQGLVVEKLFKADQV